MLYEFEIQSGVVLTNQTSGARYGIPVVHRCADGREFGPADAVAPAPALAAVFARHGRGDLPERTWGDHVREWRDEKTHNTDGTALVSARTADEIAAADSYLSQLGRYGE